MTLHYTASAEDYLAFNMFHYRNSSLYRREIRLLRWLFPLLMLAIGVLIIRGNYWPAYLPVLLLAAAWAVFFPGLFARLLLGRVKGMIKSGLYSGYIGANTLQIGEGSLTHRAGQETAEYGRDDFLALAEDEQRYYIYTSPLNAIVLPKAALADNARRAIFLEYMNKLTKKPA